MSLKTSRPRLDAASQILERLKRQTGQFGPSLFDPLGYTKLFEYSKPAPPVIKPVRKVGVLLVHGIGDQRRGNTLTSFGEPLFRCLERWLRNHKGGASLERVILRDDPTEPHTPAYATVRLWYEPEKETSKAKPDAPAPADKAEDTADKVEAAGNKAEVAADTGEAEAATSQHEPVEEKEKDKDKEKGTAPAGDPNFRETTWLLAESNWAEVFEQPSFGNVAFWAVRVVPWMILTQFVDQLSEALRRERLGRALFSLSYLVVTFPLALLIQLFVLMLVPVSLVPLLRPVVAPLQRWISSVIGDSYVLLTSRFQFQSMVSKVQQDIDWLTPKCDVVTVLAHSQGAAVAHEAVRQAKNPKVEKLITFGSALSRLKALGWVMENAGGMLWASSLLTLASLVLAGLYLWNLLSGGSSPLYAVFGLWSLGILLALSAYLMPFTLKQINALRHQQQGFQLPEGTEWDDYYSTADPVPNGEMLPETYTSTSREVHNRANVFTDHSAYWRNEDEFGGAVLGSLMKLSGGRFEQQTRGLLNSRDATQNRGRRTRYRVGARVAALAAAAAAAFQPPFFEGGIAVPAVLQPVVTWAAMFVNWLILLASDAISVAGETLNLMGRDVVLPQINVPVTRVLWPVACVAAVLFWLAASAGVLRWWDALATEEHFRSVHSWRAKRPPRVWWTWFSVLALAWLSFWVAWIITSPRDLWAALAAKSEPVLETTGNTSVYLPLIVYYIVNTILETVKAQRKLAASFELTRSAAEGLRGAPAKPSFELPTLAETFEEGFSYMLERLGAREFSGKAGAVLSAVTALGALGFVLFDFEIRAVVQAALGLLALSCGVLGWVRGEGYFRIAAAFGLLVGVVVMPAATAWQLGITSRAGAGLLAVGLGASACAFGGAEFLRRGWRAILEPPDTR